MSIFFNGEAEAQRGEDPQLSRGNQVGRQTIGLSTQCTAFQYSTPPDDSPQYFPRITERGFLNFSSGTWKERKNSWPFPRIDSEDYFLEADPWRNILDHSYSKDFPKLNRNLFPRH